MPASKNRLQGLLARVGRLFGQSAARHARRVSLPVEEMKEPVMFNVANVKAAASPDLLTPDNAVMLFVDHQPQMFFGTGSGDRT
ncbi:hypothetical protein ACWD27_39370, partial [Streptomyces sp. NPDC002758]